MKKLIVLIACILFFSPPIFAQDTMKLVYYNDFAPFSWEDGENQMHGILIDIIDVAIQKQMGIHVSHKGYQWARAQKKVRNGEADAFITVPTPARREYTKINTEPFIVGQVTIFTSKDNAKMEELKKITKLSDLKDFELLDYLGNGWAKKNFPDFNVEWYAKIDDVLLKLAEEQGDVFVHSSQVANYMINKLGLKEQLVEIPIVLESIDFNICIRKDSPYINIITELDEIIRKTRADGSLQEIYDRYK
jgi:polar amino acid transport system substrate-binding protein